MLFVYLIPKTKHTSFNNNLNGIMVALVAFKCLVPLEIEGGNTIPLFSHMELVFLDDYYKNSTYLI